MTQEKDAAKLAWSELDVDVVMECTGAYLTKEKCNAHLTAGARRVLMSAPPKDETPIYVYGVNHHKYNSNETVISNASCTTNCLAPLVKVINDRFGLVEGLMTTVHATTMN